MSKLALEMWQMTNEAFMEQDLALLSKVMEKENKLNNLEKEIIVDLVALSQEASNKQEKAKIVLFTDIAEDFELIGDYCKDILERVQIKIEEKLLFSDEAVKEYEDLYAKTEKALKKIVSALEKREATLVKEIIENKPHFESLVDKYRARHNQRLIDGICSPLACNMFLNILDFTREIYNHTQKIARNLLK
jgi:phosphate:Na+ symporter